MADPMPLLRYLTADDVRAAMPPLEERLALAEQALVAVATPGVGELPPKIGVHPRPDRSFAHAMPAHLRGGTPTADLLGMKWVAGVDANVGRGWPAISALIVLNDAGSGIPVAILDGGPVTAERTAAVSGVAIRRFAPRVSGRPVRAAIVGAGVQGRSHLPVLGYLLPGVEVRIAARHAERAEALAEIARATPGIGGAAAAASPRAAIEGADVVVTAASFTTPERRQPMTPDWLTPEALVVAVDYATICSAEVARSADRFLVDERGQFLAARDAGQFDGYPDPTAMLGEAIHEAIHETVPRSPGRVVVTHLGIGLADVVFGAAILARATDAGTGQLLPR